MHSDRSRAIQHKDAQCPFTAPMEPSSPGPCRLAALAACCDRGEGGLWALKDFEMSPHLSHGSGELLCPRDLVLQDRLAVPSLLLLPLPWHLPAPAAPGTARGARHRMSISSFGNV